MEEKTVIPEEIRSFLSSEGGNSLIVKGDTGVGKTTFALDVMEKFYGVTNTEYISIRVGEESLFRQYPWLKKKMKKDDIVENARKLLNSFYSDDIVESVSMEEVEKTQTFLSKKLLESIYEDEEEVKEAQREELQKLEGKVERGEIITEEEELDERIKNEFVFEIGKTLPELDRAYELVDRNLPEKSLIVVDSIKALSEHYGIPKDKIVSTLQKDLVENSNTNIIFIAESLEKTDLEYLVDGVVELKGKEIKNRTIREMEIKKLKTEQVKNSNYLYTLENGKFRTIKKIQNDLLNPDLKNEGPFVVSGEEKISTGNEGLDEMIGGFKARSSHLIEIDKKLPRRFFETVLISMIKNSCQLDRGTVVLPPFGSGSSFIKNLVADELDEEKMENLLLLQAGEGTSEENIRLIGGEDIHHDLNKEMVENSLSDSSEPFTVILSLDSLKMIYGEDIFSKLGRVISSLKEGGHTVVLIGPDDVEGINKLEFATDMILDMKEIENTACIYGDKPKTSIHALSMGRNEGKQNVIPLN